MNVRMENSHDVSDIGSMENCRVSVYNSDILSEIRDEAETVFYNEQENSRAGIVVSLRVGPQIVSDIVLGNCLRVRNFP